MRMSVQHIHRGWRQISVMILMFFLLTSVPWLGEAGIADRWQTLTEAGTTARDQAQYEDAERLFLLASQETEQFDPGDRRVAATLNNLGLVYHAQGQYARAKPYYEQALARWEQALGSDHADVGSALNNLAEIYQEEGALEQAETAYLARSRSVNGPLVAAIRSWQSGSTILQDCIENRGASCKPNHGFVWRWPSCPVPTEPPRSTPRRF